MTWLSAAPTADATTVGSWLPALIASLLGFAAAYLGYRASTRAAKADAKLEAEKVDAAAYERAKGLYEAGIEQLEEQLRRLSSDVENWRGRTAMAEEVAVRLQSRVSELELTISRMRRQLVLAGVEPLNGGSAS